MRNARHHSDYNEQQLPYEPHKKKQPRERRRQSASFHRVQRAAMSARSVDECEDFMDEFDVEDY